MDILNGIKNFLGLINDNWTAIIVIIGLALALFKKIQSYMNSSTDEKIAIAKAQLQETILKFITEAELSYEEWNQAGSIKRSQVISEIFEQYPILSRVADQESMIKWIDDEINNSLKTLRKIVKENLSPAVSEQPKEVKA